MATVRLTQHSAAAAAATLSLSRSSRSLATRRIVFVFVPRARLVPRDAAVASQPMQSFFSAALLCAYHKNRFSESLRSRGYGRNQRDSASVALRAAPLRVFRRVAFRARALRCVTLQI